jgi:hypothetical protein
VGVGRHCVGGECDYAVKTQCGDCLSRADGELLGRAGKAQQLLYLDLRKKGVSKDGAY